MAHEFRSPDWDTYRMDYQQPHAAIEPLEQEVRVVGEALEALRDAGVLSHTHYGLDRMQAFRAAVAESFEIPWSAITPRMQRLLYAIGAIAQPQVMVAAGVFCGFTFIGNAGAAVGPGACYAARRLVGLEIKPDEAERAERNVRAIDPTGVATIVAADAVEYVAAMPEAINLLYLDADGDRGRGKGIYLEITEAALPRMHPGSLVLAHNSVNCADRLGEYLGVVRDPARFTTSVNVVFDGEGLEVSRL